MKILFLSMVFLLVAEGNAAAQGTNSISSNIVQQAAENQILEKKLEALEQKIAENEKRLKRLEIELRRKEQKEAREAMERKDAAGIPRFATPPPAPGADANTRAGASKYISSQPAGKSSK
jgi:hypothetical protein